MPPHLLKKIKQVTLTKKKFSGFLLIELIIAIFILSLGLIGIFRAFSMTNTLTTEATEYLIATYLAQEGMEIIRGIRDTNWLNNDDWAEDLNICKQSSCCVDYKDLASANPNIQAAGGKKLVIDSDGFYLYDPPGQSMTTKFKRVIKIDELKDFGGDSNHAMKVSVSVTWDTKPNIFSSSTQREIKVEEVLYDWYEILF